MLEDECEGLFLGFEEGGCFLLLDLDEFFESADFFALLLVSDGEESESLEFDGRGDEGVDDVSDPVVVVVVVVVVVFVELYEFVVL